MSHRIGADHHHRAHDLFLVDLRSVAPDRAHPEFLQLSFLEICLVLRRHRIARKHDGLALIAGPAIEPIDRDSFRGRLEQQSVVVGLPLFGFGAHLHLRAVACDVDELFDGQIMTGQRDGLVDRGGTDRIDNLTPPNAGRFAMSPPITIGPNIFAARHRFIAYSLRQRVLCPFNGFSGPRRSANLHRAQSVHHN